MKIIDCHYCKYAYCETSNSYCDCMGEDNCYFDHHIVDSKKEAEECDMFEYDDYFPKI